MFNNHKEEDTIIIHSCYHLTKKNEKNQLKNLIQLIKMPGEKVNM